MGLGKSNTGNHAGFIGGPMKNFVQLGTPKLTGGNCATIQNTNSNLVPYTTAGSSLSYMSDYWRYHVCCYIISADDLGSAKQFTGMAFYASTGSSGGYTQTNQRIVMAHCAELGFSGTTAPTGSSISTMSTSNLLTITDETDVLEEGSRTVSAGSGWMDEIPFDNNFCYNGTDNVVVMVINGDYFYPTDYAVYGLNTTLDDGNYSMLWDGSDSQTVPNLSGYSRTQRLLATRFYY